MKFLRYISIGIIAVYFALTCSEPPGHDHSHEEKQNHTHTADTDENTLDHDHENDQILNKKSLSEASSPEQEELEKWAELIDLKTAEAQRIDLEEILKVPGKIVPDQNQIAVVSPFLESSINCVMAEIGDWVAQGDELICLSSPEIGILRAEFDKAFAEQKLKQQIFERQKKLFQENIISKRSFQEAELEFQKAQVNYTYARKKLLAIGISETELSDPPVGHSDAVGSTQHIHAPISGVITARNATMGEKVNATHRLFEIINPTTVWGEAEIFEKDLTKINLGQLVYLKVSAYPEENFSGKIFYISSTLNKTTKTIKVLIDIENKEYKLKPNMFAQTSIVTGKKENVLVISRKAVLEDEGLQIVFLKEPQGFHRHVIKTGLVSGSYVEVLEGIPDNAEVVTRGNYQLKSKLKMNGVDPHAGHSH
ncbi:MAG: efflux RND transporter periplasmic adaptor subunit [bacterium]